MIKKSFQNETFPSLLSCFNFIVHTMCYFCTPAPLQRSLQSITVVSMNMNFPSAVILFYCDSILATKNICLMIKVEMWHYCFHYHQKTPSISPHWLWSKIYYLIIYLFYQEKKHIKPPDSDPADATGKCTLEWIDAGEKGQWAFHK